MEAVRERHDLEQFEREVVFGREEQGTVHPVSSGGGWCYCRPTRSAHDPYGPTDPNADAMVDNEVHAV
nr:hypothetical protein GCM10017611_24010 [Rhodococcus wratislaviensis]